MVFPPLRAIRPGRVLTQDWLVVPIDMDIHPDLGDVTEEDIQAAHQRDLDTQDDYGVQFLTYWFNSPDGHGFCLVEAPSEQAAIQVHKASHGLVPHKLIEVERPTVSQFMEIGATTLRMRNESEVPVHNSILG